MPPEEMIYVQLLKTAVAPEARVPPGDPATFPYGRRAEGTSLPVNYALQGWMEGMPTLGRGVTIWRTNRNGVQVFGYFNSTEVVDVGDRIFVTRNSRYYWEPITPVIWPKFSDLPDEHRESFRASTGRKSVPVTGAGAQEYFHPADYAEWVRSRGLMPMISDYGPLGRGGGG